MFLETEFLSLAQAIESFHRLTDDTTVMNPVQFADLRKSIAAAIDQRCSDPIAARLKEAIRFANEPSFQARIDALLGRLPSEAVVKLLGDPQAFGQALRQTRNYLTHQGGKVQSHVVTDTGELYRMNQKLHALLRFLLLTHLGFPPELVLEPVYNQASRRTLL